MDKLKIFGKLLSAVFFKGPGMLTLAGNYLEAWNSHDVDAIIKLTADGSYRDPICGHPVTGNELREHANMLIKAFPDLKFELTSAIAAGDGVVSARYTLHGTNNGDLPGDIGFETVTATGKRMALNGSIFFEFNTSGSPVVTNYFDQQEFGDNVGFQSFTVPQQMGDYDFGAYFRLNRGNQNPPNAIGITWLHTNDPSQFNDAAALTRKTLEDFAAGPGFVTGIIGAKRPDDTGFASGFTISAWETVEDMDRILASPKHQEVVQKFMKEGLASGTHSRVYQLVREKPIMIACTECGKKNNANKADHVCSACKSRLPPAPRYW